MERLANALFSLRMMTVALFVFLVSIGIATFLESAYDVQAAKILVYNATWFEVLLVYLGINLIANIFRYNMFKREKIAILMFHLSFIVMLIGAGITRYISFEGMMIIKEGEQSDFIYLSEPHLWFRINDDQKQYTYSKPLYMSEVSNNYFDIDVAFPKHRPITIEYVNFRKNLVDSLVVNDSIRSASFEIVTNGMQSNYVSVGDFMMVGDVAISYGKNDEMPGIQLYKKGPKTMIRTEVPLRSISMAQLRQSGQNVTDSMYTIIPQDTIVPFQSGALYALQSGEQFAFKGVVNNSKKMLLQSPIKNAGPDYLTIRIKDGDEIKEIDIAGGADAFPRREVFNFGGLTYQMEYGRIRKELPFAVACRDFILDRYPGSNRASSFASEVTIIDQEKDYTRDQRIFMNNVMDYRGYRFFQASYEPDESGTRLSVNHDWWGTNISYLGYLMMGIGMLMSLFAPVGRFRQLNTFLKKSREKRSSLLPIFLIAFILPNGLFAQHDHDHDHDHEHDHSEHAAPPKKDATFSVMSKEHSEELSALLVQDYKGRFIPMHTFSDQLMRKIYRSDKYEEYNAVQMIMSMHLHRDYWMDQELIYVSSKGGLRDKLEVKGKHIAFNNLIDDEGNFVLDDAYNKAHQKLESKRDEFDKQVLKLAEKYEAAAGVFFWKYFNVVPVKNDPANKWYSPIDISILRVDSVAFQRGIKYIAALDSASSGLKSYSSAEIRLKELKSYQNEVGGKLVPSESLIQMEISYNKMGVFKNSMRTYITLGFIALMIFFIGIFVKPTERARKVFKRIGQVIAALTIAIFVYHGYGLYMRWMISGHAPWSSGYEAVVFIAWITVLTGLIFSRKNAVVLAATLILASLMIFVSEMNLMDPQISQLEPVLKSYWLMIHVAIITGSYGPLGIACILGILNLLLYIFRTKKNAQIVTLNINELTHISEMTMTIGLYMLTIGTFLGGIWANESWGRYWGWDPKETWALVAVLTYAVILHLRFIPDLKSKFIFNSVSMWGYASILFTFFGVNFYLSGLHSYAQGESFGVFPKWILVTVLVFVLFNIIAGIRNWQYKKSLD
jgi:cytochrome c-type biogenesis protein CcsB